MDLKGKYKGIKAGFGMGKEFECNLQIIMIWVILKRSLIGIIGFVTESHRLFHKKMAIDKSASTSIFEFNPSHSR